MGLDGNLCEGLFYEHRFAVLIIQSCAAVLDIRSSRKANICEEKFIQQSKMELDVEAKASNDLKIQAATRTRLSNYLSSILSIIGFWSDSLCALY